MTSKVFRFLLSLAVISASLSAVAQSTFVVPNGTGTVDRALRPTNRVFFHTVTEPSFIMTPIIRVNGGRLFEQPGHEDTFGRDARVRISRQFSTWSQNADFSLTTAGGFHGYVDLVPGQKLTSLNFDPQFVGRQISTGEILRIEFFEAFDDGPDGEPESVFNNTSFTFGIPVELPSISGDLGLIPEAATITQHVSPGQTRWFTFELTRPVSDNHQIEITTKDTSGFGANNNTEIALYGSRGTLIYVDDDSGPGFTSRLLLSSLSAGRYYVAVTGFNGVFNEYFDAVSHSPESGDITLSLRYIYQPPTVFQDFGPISTDIQTQQYYPNDFPWYKFTLPNGIAPGDYFAISTRNTTAFSAGTRGPNDTKIALYSDTGALVVTNDDADLSEGVLTSLLEFGGENLSLPPGTYYLALGGHEFEFLPFWTIIYPNVLSGRGDIVLDLLFTQPFWDVSGTVTLSDFTADPQGEPVAWEVRDFLGTTVDSGTSFLGAGGSYQFNTPVFGTGYTLWMKGQTWIGKSVFGVNLMEPATVDFTLVNGDVNGDNEIAASDLSILSAAFLATELDPLYERIADLDRDGEVGSSDLAIVSQGFLQVGD